MITRIYVHNFRCLENFELSLKDKASTLVVGGNGTGKTTLRKALELLQTVARGTNHIRDLVKPEDFARGRADVPMRFEIDVVIKAKSYAYVLALELPEGFKELRIHDESLSMDGVAIYSRVGAQVTVKEDSKFLLDWHLVALPLVFEQSAIDPLRIFKLWLARMLILAPIPSLITGDSSGDTLLPAVDGTNFGEWFSGLLADYPSAYALIDKQIREVLPDFKDMKNPIIGKDSRSLVVQFHAEPASLLVPFSALSDGEKCFFIWAVAVAATQAYGPLFCFWDEPDNYLAISEVGNFVMDLRRAFRDGNQILVTSHNSEAIRQFPSENICLLHRRNHLEPSQVRPMDQIEVHGDLVNALIRGDVEP